MSDILRNLRGTAKPILLVAAGFLFGGIYGEGNGALLVIAVALSAVACIILLQKQA